MPSKTGATTTQYSVIRESTTSRGASIVTAFTLLVLISLDPFTVASDSYKAQRRRTAVDKDQQGCLPYSDAPIILVDPVWVQDDDDDMYRFSCADGAFLVGAEPAVIQLSYSRRSVATGASFIQSIKWTCSNGVESEISDGFSTSAAADDYRRVSFNVSITGVSARYSPYPSCVTTGGGTVSKDFCYHVGRLIFTGYEYDDDSNTAAGVSFGPFGDDDFFNDPIHTPDAFSECGANELATGVTTWEDSLGLSAIRLECAEYEANACVPPNLGGRGVTSMESNRSRTKQTGMPESPAPSPRASMPAPTSERHAPVSNHTYPDPNTHNHDYLSDDSNNSEDGDDDIDNADFPNYGDSATGCGARRTIAFVAWTAPAGVMVICLVIVFVQGFQEAPERSGSEGEGGGATPSGVEGNSGNRQQSPNSNLNNSRGDGGVSGVGGNWDNARGFSKNDEYGAGLFPAPDNLSRTTSPPLNPGGGMGGAHWTATGNRSRQVVPIMSPTEGWMLGGAEAGHVVDLCRPSAFPYHA